MVGLVYKSAFTALLGSAVVILGLNACKSPALETSHVRTISVERGVTPAGTFSGNFLAGRFAQRQQDWRAASTFVNTALSFDTSNQPLTQRAFLLSLGAGDYDRSRTLARDVLVEQPDQELALIYIAADALARGEYDTATEAASRLPADGFGEHTRPVMQAWALQGKGETDAALVTLQVAAGSDDSDATFLLHAGLINEAAGRNAEAEKHFRTLAATGLSLNSAITSAGFFARQGKPAIAAQIYDGLGKMYPFNPFINALSAAEGQKNALNPAEGAGIALFDIANALYERRAFDSAQIYGRIAGRLAPDMPAVQLLIGDITAIHGRHTEAIDIYKNVSTGSPVFWLAQMRMTEVYELAGHPEQAEAMLLTLAKPEKTRQQALISLGDFYRRQNTFERAVDAYDAALAGTGDTPAPEYWSVLYARGMALQHLNDWDRAEKDLTAALSMQPDNPTILNFIGYSWLEKGINLDRALDFTRRAASLSPDDGYIVDSYGWALYMNKRYDEAVTVLERAASLAPDDAEILHHLGDAYWKQGRRQEARYKWKRAIDLTVNARLKATLARKIEKGIEETPTARADIPAPRL